MGLIFIFNIYFSENKKYLRGIFGELFCDPKWSRGYPYRLNMSKRPYPSHAYGQSVYLRQGSSLTAEKVFTLIQYLYIIKFKNIKPLFLSTGPMVFLTMGYAINLANAPMVGGGLF